MHGNRDFLVTDRICKNLSINLLKDPTIIEVKEMRILLLHGDTLCTDDKEYQNFRTMVRSDVWQRKMLSKSLEERLAIASSLRKKSMDANKEKRDEIMDVNINEIEDLIKDYMPNIIIHGHTHRPNIHKHDHVMRYVLGDWYNSFFILSFDENKFIIHKGLLK